ncbi:predicted protein [Histoplasma capsulatum G186AR]|uniref:Uncharacterized protein n=1 Tax=Ajellomyces capsulatus (strain G186AR / H82 / ATCC MYA-2454 / RMSCC 2432) TaxID=447093 RepID=C0NRL9_AJECG|nr:uncharacterized protein HCBG_05799 [Histoplasma capsulatum G186AR]EEH05535.1 predicted protein [Histoplasma capsulatum G186AR]
MLQGRARSGIPPKYDLVVKWLTLPDRGCSSGFYGSLPRFSHRSGHVAMTTVVDWSLFTSPQSWGSDSQRLPLPYRSGGPSGAGTDIATISFAWWYCIGLQTTVFAAAVAGGRRIAYNTPMRWIAGFS